MKSQMCSTKEKRKSSDFKAEADSFWNKNSEFKVYARKKDKRKSMDGNLGKIMADSSGEDGEMDDEALEIAMAQCSETSSFVEETDSEAKQVSDDDFIGHNEEVDNITFQAFRNLMGNSGMEEVLVEQSLVSLGEEPTVMKEESTTKVTTKNDGVNLGFTREVFLGSANNLTGSMEETAKDLNLELVFVEKVKEVGSQMGRFSSARRKGGDRELRNLQFNVNYEKGKWELGCKRNQ